MNHEITAKRKHLTDRQRIELLEVAVDALATREEMQKMIEGVVRETMKDVLFTAGKGTKVFLVTLATIIGSIVVIGGGFKWVLTLIGFHYIK